MNTLRSLRGLYHADELILKDKSFNDVLVMFFFGFVAVKKAETLNNEKLELFNNECVLEIKGVSKVKTDSSQSVNYYCNSLF